MFLLSLHINGKQSTRRNNVCVPTSAHGFHSF